MLANSMIAAKGKASLFLAIQRGSSFGVGVLCGLQDFRVVDLQDLRDQSLASVANRLARSRCLSSRSRRGKRKRAIALLNELDGLVFLWIEIDADRIFSRLHRGNLLV